MPSHQTAALDIAVLISGSGTTLQNLIDRIAAGTLSARITQVIASRDGIAGIDRARKAGLACEVVSPKSFANRAEFSQQVFDLCRASGAKAICLAGWLSLIQIPSDFAGRVINIHPALLPAFGGAGMYGSYVHEAVLRHGCKISGCTVHFVDEHYDNGPIILQRTCPVLENDTPKTLAARVFEEEKIAYPDAINLLAHGRLKIDGRRVRISE